MPNEETITKQFEEECEDIALQCEEEGYPAHGSNYELRVEDLRRYYAQMYPDIFDEVA